MLAGSRSTPPFAPRGKCPRARAWHRRTRAAPIGTASIAPAATRPLAGRAPAPTSDPTLGAVGIVPAPDDVQAAAPRALAWLARRLSRDERIPGPPGKLAPFARRQRERPLQHIVVHPGLQPLALLVETKASRESGRIYQDLFNSEFRTSESLATGPVAMRAALPYRAPAYFLSSSRTIWSMVSRLKAWSTCSAATDLSAKASKIRCLFARICMIRSSMVSV